MEFLDRLEEGPYALERNAKAILQAIGSVENPSKTTEYDLQRRVSFFTSPGVVKLAKRSLNKIGERTAALGIRRAAIRPVTTKPQPAKAKSPEANPTPAHTDGAANDRPKEDNNKDDHKECRVDFRFLAHAATVVSFVTYHAFVTQPPDTVSCLSSRWNQK